MPLENLEGHEFLLGTAFWFPISKEHNDNRIKILECALEDLERIKKEGEPKLPPITEDEPIIIEYGRFSKAYPRGKGNPYAYRRDLE